MSELPPLETLRGRAAAENEEAEAERRAVEAKEARVRAMLTSFAERAREAQMPVQTIAGFGPYSGGLDALEGYVARVTLPQRGFVTYFVCPTGGKVTYKKLETHGFRGKKTRQVRHTDTASEPLLYQEMLGGYGARSWREISPASVSEDELKMILEQALVDHLR